jgi:hypothetical protein
MKRISSIFVFASLLMMFACKDAAKTGDAAATTTDNTATTATTPTVDATTATTVPTTGGTAATPTTIGSNPATASESTNPETPPVPTGPTTKMEFDNLVHDFGTVKDGEKVVHIYKFKNTGKEPLIISDAKGSCGCTVPQWPREPIAPGKSGDIKVEFNSAGKGDAAGKPESKRVTITANTDPVQTYLTIKGIVKK